VPRRERLFVLLSEIAAKTQHIPPRVCYLPSVSVPHPHRSSMSHLDHPAGSAPPGRRRIPGRFRCQFVCLGLLIKPVTLPCGHTVCYACFESIMELSNLTCPACRIRLNLWVRQRRSNVVNEVSSASTLLTQGFTDRQVLWREICAKYPEEVTLGPAEQADLEFSGLSWHRCCRSTY
jgi:hypothetical protein